MLYYGQGTALVTRQEMLARRSDIAEFMTSRGTSGALSLSTGTLARAALTDVQMSLAGATPVPFTEIGLGKPLTVQIRGVYTGQYPASSWFSGQKGMLVTSAVKSITTFDAKARALNFIAEQVGAHTGMTRPAATNQGTPYVFYSPALLDNSLTLDLGMVFDSFPQQLVANIGTAFQSAAGIPIFLAHGPMLLAAGTAIKLAAQAAEMIFDGRPAFSVAGEAIDIFLPGTPVALAGYRLLTQGDVDSLDPSFRTDYQVDPASGLLVDKDGKRYNGDIPYMVISLDGAANPVLADFAPHAVSANILSRFLGAQDNESQPIDLILQAVKLYNDYVFRQKADQLTNRLQATADPAVKKSLQDERDALVKNIANDLLKPAS